VKFIVALVVAAVVAGLVIALVVVTGQRTDATFRADSLEALADSQKKVLAAQVKRAVQSEIKPDAVDKKLKTQTKVKVRAVVEIAPVAAANVSGIGVTVVDGERIDSMHDYKAPVTLDVTAVLPAPPGKGRFTYRLGIDPIPIIPSVRCSTQKYDGIHRAFVAFDSLPDWAKVNIREAQADRSVCNPPTAGFGLSMKVPGWATLLVGGVGFVVGFFVAN
jgi:hypothetical protein